MKRETILTFFGTVCSDEAIKNAITMAEISNAHLTVVMIASAPTMYSYGYEAAFGGYASVEQWTQEINEISNALEQCKERVKQAIQSSDISAEVLVEFCEISLMKEAIARHANVVDRVVLLDHCGVAADVEDEIISSVIFESNVGVIKGVNSHIAAAEPKHIFIAWDSTKHASAAVHDALSLLDKSDQVTIAIFDPIKSEAADGEEPGADLASWLSRRGCNVTVEQYPSGGEEIATCILDSALERGADLIVMGGYGHMKLKQQIFGGTTKSILQQGRFPIFISHK